MHKYCFNFKKIISNGRKSFTAILNLTKIHIIKTSISKIATEENVFSYFYKISD